MRVLVVGTLTFDVIGITADALHDSSLTVPLDAVSRSPGGRGANSAVLLAAMGREVRLVSCVGPDFAESAYQADLLSKGIDLGGLLASASVTPAVFVFTNRVDTRVYQLRDRRLTLTDAFVEWSAEQVRRWPHDALYCTSEVASVNVAALSASPCRLKAFAPGHDLLAYQPGELDACLDAADLVILNTTESDVLAGLVDRGIRRGGSTLFVTAGASGSTVHTPGGVFSVRAIPVGEVVDTTGAGDAYAAGVVHSAIESQDMVRAALTGSAMASFIIESPGCQSGIPSKRELADRVAMGGSN